MKNIKLLFLFSAFMLLLSCSKSELTPVGKYGQLKVEGTKVVGANGEIVQLSGMSLFWSQWIGKYYNYDCIKWLRDDWKCSVVRVAMAVEHDGYIANPEREMQKITNVIDAAIDLGIYVIVDFHSHRAEKNIDVAKQFFGEIAKRYGKYPNIIYEIYNEPLQVSWSEVLKPYSEEIISVIRQYDSNNIVVCGTPNWSQFVDEAALDPLDAENVAYCLHFYAGTHGQEFRDRGNFAIEKGLCLFVTEYGTTEANGDGDVYENETRLWYDWMNKHSISHCNWSVADKNEASAALVENADSLGGWTEEQIKPSAKFVRAELLENHRAMFDVK